MAKLCTLLLIFKRVPLNYAYDFASKELVRLTTDGYCVAPTYSAAAQKLAYSKMVNGIMQLFYYDLNTKHHHQLTFDKANKEECMWAPMVFICCVP